MPLRIELRRDARRFGPLSGPWLRRRQIARVLGPADPGLVAEVLDHRGDRLGWGLYSPVSEIAVRILSFDAEPARDWLEHRLATAFAARAAYCFEDEGTTGYREVNSEGDGLPGLIIDRYGDERVVQITTAPMAAREGTVIDFLHHHDGRPIHIVLPESVTRNEGLAAGVRRRDGGEVLRFYEHGLAFETPAPPGQKTGAYLDQRGNHRVIAHLARRNGRPMLDLGCHIGGFAIHAAKLGVEVIGFDRSEVALEHAARNAEVNGVQVTWVQGDLFGPLDQPPLAGRFGTVVVDPPRMASSARDRDRALAAFERIIGRIAPRISAGGHLVLCSCSHHIDRKHLDSVMVRALDGRWTRVATLGAGFDHPVAPAHIEGEYLRVNVYQRRA